VSQTLSIAATSLRTALRRPAVQQGLLVIVLSLFLMAFGEYVLESPRYFVAVTAIIAAVLLILINLRLAVTLYIVFLAAYEEYVLSSTEAFMTEGIKGSILAVRIFGIGLLDFTLLAFLTPVLIKVWHEIRSEKASLLRKEDRYLFPIIAIWLYGMLLGYFYMQSMSVFAADVRDLGYIIVFYFIISRVFSSVRDYSTAISLLLITVLLKTSVFVWRYLTGGGVSYGYDYLRPLLGSDTALVGLLLAMIIGYMFLKYHSPLHHKMILLGLIGYTTIILIAGLTRSTYVLTSFAIVLLFYLFRDRLKASTYIVALSVVLSGGLIFYFGILSDSNREIISYLLGSAFNWVEAIKLYGDLSMGQRILEVINIWETLSREGMVLLGLGWGSEWRSTKVRFRLLNR
jgi:hypothetical protein